MFGINDDDQVVGLADAESDAERISEEIKTKLDPIPTVNLEFKEVEGKKLVLLHVYKGQETPYYYIGDKQRLAFVRVGNESIVADRLQLKSLVMRGAGRSFDAIPSPLTSSMRHPRETARSTNLDENTIFLQPLVGYGDAILFVSQRVTRMKIITSDYQTVTSAS